MSPPPTGAAAIARRSPNRCWEASSSSASRDHRHRRRTSIRRAAIRCAPATEHAIEEHQRVHEFRASARRQAARGRADARAAGQLMYASHASYSALRARLRRDRPPGGAGARGGAEARALRREDHGRRQRRHGRGPGRARHATRRQPDRRALRARVGSRVGGLRRIVGWGEGIRRTHVDVLRSRT